MKKIMLATLAVAMLSLTAVSQTFEGQIDYKIEVKGENAALMGMMMPNALQITLSGKNSLVVMKGGMAPIGDILSKSDGNTYMIYHNKKTAYIMPKDEKKPEENTKPTVEVKGTETIKGYKCTKYLVKFPKTDKGEVYQYMWATKDLNITPPKGEGKSAAYFLEEIDGFPVKIDQYITASAQGQTMVINMELTLDKISKEKPADALFQVPAKYKVEPYDEAEMMKMMGGGK